MKRLCLALLCAFLSWTAGAQNRSTDQGKAHPSQDWRFHLTKVGGVILTSAYLDTVSSAFRVTCTNCGGSTSVLAADGAANPTIPQSSVFPFFFNGTTWDRARGDLTSGLWVNIKSSVAIGVTGTFWQATQPVSGPLTDAQLRASAVPVDINDPMPAALGANGGFKVECLSGCGGAAAFADNAAFTFGSTSIGNMGAVVDDTATNVVTENSAGAPRMSTSRVLLSMSADSTGAYVNPQGRNWTITETVPVSGTFWQATQPVSGTVTANAGTGTFVVGDGTGPLTVDGTVIANAGTGTFTVDTEAATATAAPAGTEVGLITRNIPSGTQPVSGTFWQATQPVSGTFWQATQPVSGTVTSNQGTANTAANRWPIYLTDGTNTMPTADAGARRLYTALANGGTELGTAGTGTGLTVTCTNCGGAVEGATYFASGLGLASAASKDYINLYNATGSGKIIKILKIWAAADSQAATTGLQPGFTMRRFTTAGATCTAITIVLADTINAAVPAQVTAGTNCTTDPAGTTADLGRVSFYPDETQPGTQMLYEHSGKGGQPITLREGQGLMLLSGASAPATVLSLTIEFTM